MVTRKLSYLILICLFFSSCASIPAVEGRVRGLAAKGDFQYAAQLVSRLDHGIYGKNNRLLETLDRGMIFYYAGDHQKSIKAFEDAKRIYDELYTKSVSKIAASWLWNDSTLPYPGEDFERAMINVVQALNFVALKQYQGALVEARNAVSVLQKINGRYDPSQKNVYTDDAFLQLLAGIIYESFGDRQEMNDAFLSYKKSFAIYEKKYAVYYHIKPPRLLKEGLLRTAHWMGQQEFQHYQKMFSDMNAQRVVNQDRKDAEVFLIVFRGQIVNKVSSSIVLPGMDGLLTRISFPRYRKSLKGALSTDFTAQSSDGTKVEEPLEKVEDLDAIARENLENRRLRILAKAVARPLTKQLMVEALEDKVRDKTGDEAASIFNYAGNFYLLYSEQADLRGWETLPSEIFLSRLFLPAGEYHFWIGDKEIAHFSVEPGNIKFIMHWLAY